MENHFFRFHPRTLWLGLTGTLLIGRANVRFADLSGVGRRTNRSRSITRDLCDEDYLRRAMPSFCMRDSNVVGSRPRISAGPPTRMRQLTF